MNIIKKILADLIPSGIWRWLRMKRILARHGNVATVCERLIDSCPSAEEDFSMIVKADLGNDRIIWQYWAQGYDEVPDVVRQCLDSVDKYAEGYKVIRLTDDNLNEYIDLPDFVQEKRQVFSRAFFSDLLRCLLLSTYGGLWLDATILLTAPIPDEFVSGDFFLFQRDPSNPDRDYWENTYAYYFGWEKGFRVNMLSSFLYASKGCAIIQDSASLLLKWWKENDYLPDYFFFQILFDVLIKGKYSDQNCKIVSDTLPHYLQQSINDPKFNLMAREDILASIPVHKLTYK